MLVKHGSVILVVILPVRVVLLGLQDLDVGVILNLWQTAIQIGQASVFRIKRAVTSDFFYLLLVIRLL